ncbi:MAG: conjugal transfer protein TraL, partial [Tatlockia sp.]|nr:conjugal transfer protein TraL [Tatlockia sp.]
TGSTYTLGLMERIPPTHDDCIIDNGSNSFLDMSHYLNNKTLSSLTDKRHALIIHTVVTGGQALYDTINGFSQLISQIPNKALFVVWLNPFFGPVEDQGKGFEQMKAYKDNQDRITALISIPALNKDMFGRDLTDMLSERLIFDEAIANPSRFIITRQRLTMIRRQLFEQIDKAVVV